MVAVSLAARCRGLEISLGLLETVLHIGIHRNACGSPCATALDRSAEILSLSIDVLLKTAGADRRFQADVVATCLAEAGSGLMDILRE